MNKQIDFKFTLNFDAMTTTIKIEGMTCKHCVAHVSALVGEIIPQGKFSVSLENKSIELESSDEEIIQKIKKTINEDGIYKAI